MHRIPVLIRGLLLAFLLLILLPQSDVVGAPYYEGKTIKILSGWRPGGTANLRARVTVKYLRKYIEGDPVFVFQFMPGAGGIGATNYLAHSAKRDGFTIASATSGICKPGSGTDIEIYSTGILISGICFFVVA